jgi:hypothetical protein
LQLEAGAGELLAGIDPETLRELEKSIFERGQGSVEEAADRFPRADLETTIREARATTRSMLDELPEHAFEAQPLGSAGETVWSAGEIVGHLAEAMLWFEFALTRLAGCDAAVPADMPGVIMRDRAGSLATLEFADRVLDRNLATAATLSDVPRMDIEGLGTLGERGLLLLHAMHEVEHALQVRVLGDVEPT